MKRFYLSLFLLVLPCNLCFAEDYNISNDRVPVNNSVPKPKVYNTFHRKHDNIILQTDTTKASEAAVMASRAALDPYVVKIKNVKYYMVKNSPDGIYTKENIIGLNNNKNSLFEDMKQLNSDKDNTKITAEELKKAGIRFVAVDNNKKLMLHNKEKDYPLDNISYIDLANLRETINNGSIGSFGYFDMYIKTNEGPKKIIGYVSFDTEDELTEMIR